MNVVGEWVSRPVPGRSIPRGASAPPQTRHVGVRLLDRVVRLGEQGEVGGRGRRRSPFSSNCGIQKRFRFGSLPTITSRISGTPRTIAATYEANCRARRVGERRRRGPGLVDGEEDAQSVRTRRRRPAGRRAPGRGEPRGPAARARDPDGSEACVAQLVELRPRLADGVVDRADEERRRLRRRVAVARPSSSPPSSPAASPRRSRRSRRASARGGAHREGRARAHDGLAGRVAWTNETVSRYWPGADARRELERPTR